MPSNQPGEKALLSFAGLFVAAACLPLFAGRLLGVPLVALDNFTDAVFYLSYARHFGELVLRYGFPYYATRFGGILPDAVSGSLFGEIHGIWILRYGLSASVSGVLFLFFRKRYGVLAGLLASLFWSFNPAALRLLCTTYVDSTAVPFLIIGCCLFDSQLGNRWNALLAGCFLALAASAHLYAAFALILLIPWLIGSMWGNRKEFFRALSWMLTGFLITFSAGWLWYWSIWGMPSLFSPTLEVLRDLGNGQAALWKKPLSAALMETPAWIAPWVLLIPVSLVSKRGSFLMRGIAFSLLASSAFFWGGDLFGSAYVLSMPFYYSFMVPVTLLAVATLGGELLVVQKIESIQRLIFFSFALVSVVPPLMVHYGVLSPAKRVVITALTVLLVIPQWTKLQKRKLVLFSIIGTGAASLLLSSTGMFAQMLGHYPRNDIPVLELAAALNRELPKAANDGSVMRFWYDDDLTHAGGMDRRMIQAFWLHTFGKLTGAKGQFVTFPSISDADAEAVRFIGVDRLVIFDQDPARVNLALEEIQKRKLPFKIKRRLVLTAPSDPKKTLNVAILERELPMAQEVSVINPQAWEVYHNGSILAKTEEGIQLMSGKIKWWDFAKLPLGAIKTGELLVIRCRVESGMIRFALHEGSSDNSIKSYVDKWVTSGTQEAILIAPCDMNAAILTLYSMYPRGSSSKISIDKMEKENFALTP